MYWQAKSRLQLNPNKALEPLCNSLVSCSQDIHFKRSFHHGSRHSTLASRCSSTDHNPSRSFCKIRVKDVSFGNTGRYSRRILQIRHLMGPDFGGRFRGHRGHAHSLTSWLWCWPDDGLALVWGEQLRGHRRHYSRDLACRRSMALFGARRLLDWTTPDEMGSHPY